MDANARNGDDRVSTPKSDSGSTFTSPTKSIVSEPSFDRSFSSASSRINTPNIDSFITPRRDSLGISTAELTVTAASEYFYKSGHLLSVRCYLKSSTRSNVPFFTFLFYSREFLKRTFFFVFQV